MREGGDRPALVGGKGRRVLHTEPALFSTPASLLLYHLTLRSDLKSAVVIDGLQQVH